MKTRPATRKVVYVCKNGVVYTVKDLVPTLNPKSVESFKREVSHA